MTDEYVKFYVAYNIYSKYWDVYMECNECGSKYWNILDHRSIEDVSKTLEEYKNKRCYQCTYGVQNPKSVKVFKR